MNSLPNQIPSTVTVERKIAEFLAGTSPEVLALTGAWGVGKTYLWNRLLESLKQDGTIGFTAYGYISLFGINSISEMKMGLFENSAPLKSPNVAFKWIKTRKDTLQPAAEFAKLGHIYKALEPAMFSTIRKQLVCIDDLERRGKNLTISDVLGLVSFLKEERQCRVALLLNSAELGGDAAEFKRQIEKVIDVELHYEPSAIEAAEIAFSSSDRLSIVLRELSSTLHIKNIRVLKKIERIALEASKDLTTFDLKVTEDVLRAVVLFAWIRYEPDRAPSDWLRRAIEAESADPEDYTDADMPGQRSDQEVREDALIASYSLHYLDQFDFFLMRGVQAGYFDRSEMLRFGAEREKALRVANGDLSVKTAWEAAHDSFAENLDDCVQRVVAAMRSGVGIGALGALNKAIVFLRAVGKNQELNDLISLYRSSRGVDFWTTDDLWLFGEPLDAEVEAALLAVKSQAAVSVSPVDLLLEITDNQKYKREDLQVLAKLTAEDLRRIILAHSGEKMRKIIYGGLYFRRFSNPSENEAALLKNMQEALDRIAKTSPLNAWRVSRFLQ